MAPNSKSNSSSSRRPSRDFQSRLLHSQMMMTAFIQALNLLLFMFVPLTTLLSPLQHNHSLFLFASAQSPTVPPSSTKDPTFEAERNLFCSFTITASQPLITAFTPQAIRALTSATVENRRCMTPYGGQIVHLDTISNLLDYGDLIVTPKTTTTATTTNVSTTAATMSTTMMSTTVPSTTNSSGNNSIATSAPPTTTPTATTPTPSPTPTSSSSGSNSPSSSPVDPNNPMNVDRAFLDSDANTEEEEEEERARAEEPAQGIPPHYANPYQKYPVYYQFRNATFLGATGQIIFNGFVVNPDTKVFQGKVALSNIVARMRPYVGTNTDLDFGSRGLNGHFSPSFILNYFTDETTPSERVMRLPFSPLRTNRTMRRIVSNFIQESLVESTLSAAQQSQNIQIGQIALKRPLYVLIDSCRFLGGAHVNFRNVLPVGTKIIIRNTNFKATYDQLIDDTMGSLRTNFVYSRGFISFQNAHIFGSKIQIINNQVTFLRSPATSANSSFFTTRNSLERIGGDSFMSFVCIGEMLMLHNTVLIIDKTSMRVEGNALPGASFLHPNASGIQRALKRYNVSSDGAEFSPILVSETLATQSALLGSNEITGMWLMTESTRILIRNTNVEVDGRSVLVPASDEMWFRMWKRNDTQTNDWYATTTTPTTTRPPANETRISYQQFRRDFPDALPRTCFVLEVPTFTSFSVVRFMSTFTEVSEFSKITVENVTVDAQGYEARGGRTKRQTANVNLNNPDQQSATEREIIGSGNQYHLDLNRITDATALKIVMDVAHVFGTVYRDGTNESAIPSIRTLDPPQVSGLSNVTLRNTLMEIEKMIMRPNSTIGGNGAGGNMDTSSLPILSAEEEARFFEADAYYRSVFTRPTIPFQSASTDDVAAFYHEYVFDSLLQKPIPTTFTFVVPFDIEGVYSLQQYCRFPLLPTDATGNHSIDEEEAENDFFFNAFIDVTTNTSGGDDHNNTNTTSNDRPTIPHFGISDNNQDMIDFMTTVPTNYSNFVTSNPSNSNSGGSEGVVRFFGTADKLTKQLYQLALKAKRTFNALGYDPIRTALRFEAAEFSDPEIHLGISGAGGLELPDFVIAAMRVVQMSRNSNSSSNANTTTAMTIEAEKQQRIINRYFQTKRKLHAVIKRFYLNSLTLDESSRRYDGMGEVISAVAPQMRISIVASWTSCRHTFNASSSIEVAASTVRVSGFVLQAVIFAHIGIHARIDSKLVIHKNTKLITERAVAIISFRLATGFPLAFSKVIFGGAFLIGESNLVGGSYAPPSAIDPNVVNDPFGGGTTFGECGVIIEDFSIVMHQTSKFCVRTVVSAAYFDHGGIRLTLRGNGTKIRTERVNFAVNLQPENILRTVALSLEVAPIFIDGDLLMSGEDFHTTMRFPTPAGGAIKTYPYPPMMVARDIFFNTSVMMGTVSAVRFGFASKTCEMMEKSLIAVSNIYFTTRFIVGYYNSNANVGSNSPLSSTPTAIVSLPGVVVPRETSAGVAFRIDGGTVMFMSGGAQFNIFDIRVTEDQPWVSVCRSYIGYDSKPSMFSADLSAQITMNGTGTGITIRNTSFVALNFCNNQFSGAIFQLSSDSLLKMIDGAVVRISDSNITVPLNRNFQYFNKTSKRFEVDFDLSLRENHAVGLFRMQYSNFILERGSIFEIVNSRGQFDVGGRNTKTFSASLVGTSINSNFLVVNGSKFIIRNSEVSMTPWDASDAEKSLMRKSATPQSSSSPSSAPPSSTSASPNPWSWAAFVDLTSTNRQRIGLPFGGVTAPSFVVCTVISFLGKSEVSPSGTLEKLLADAASLLPTARNGAHASIIVEDVTANIFCGIQNRNMTQAFANELGPESVAKVNYLPTFDVSLNSAYRVSAFYFSYDSVSKHRYASPEAFYVKNLRASVFYSYFTDKYKRFAGPAIDPSTAVNHWAPADFPLFFGRVNLLDTQASFDASLVSSLVNDVNNPLTSPNYPYSLFLKERFPLNFAQSRAMSSIFRFCGLTLNGQNGEEGTYFDDDHDLNEAITSSTIPFWYPYGYEELARSGAGNQPSTSTAASSTTTTMMMTTAAADANTSAVNTTTDTSPSSTEAPTNVSEAHRLFFAAADNGTSAPTATDNNMTTVASTVPSTSAPTSTMPSTSAPPPVMSTTAALMTTTTTQPPPTPTTGDPFQIMLNKTRRKQWWLLRGLEMYVSARNVFLPLRLTSNILTRDRPTGNTDMFAPDLLYQQQFRVFLDNYFGFCPRTETAEMTKTISKVITVSESVGKMRTISASDTLSDTAASPTQIETETVSQTFSQTSSVTKTRQETASESLQSLEITMSESASISAECNRSTIISTGIYWRDNVISQQVNPKSEWWKRVFESDVLNGLKFTFTTQIAMPPNITDENGREITHSSTTRDENGNEVIKARAIMYKSAATPRERPLNFHGIRGASSPSYPYAVATVTNRVNVMLEMRALPEFEIYAPEWWDIYLPASFVAVGPCADNLLKDDNFTKMWGAIAPGPEVQIFADDGLNPKENVYVYFTTIVIDPNVDKPLADFAEGFSAAANGFAIAVGALSSTVIASASSEIQAVGIFAHMESCNSPQISAFFGSPWVLSPVYLDGVFGDTEKDKMLSIIVGNCGLILIAVLIQTLIMCTITVFCDPTEDKRRGNGEEEGQRGTEMQERMIANRGNADEDKNGDDDDRDGFVADDDQMTVSGAARFPSVTLSIMFGLHGGTVFAACRMMRLIDLNSDNYKTNASSGTSSASSSSSSNTTTSSSPIIGGGSMDDKDNDFSTEVAKYFIPAFIVLVYYVAFPLTLYISAWWCIPRTFQIYDLQHRSVKKAMAASSVWITRLLPVGAIYPQSTRQSAGIFISAFRRSSHFWVTSPLWVSSVSGIIGFAQLNDVEDYGACFTWGVLIGVFFLALAAVNIWRMPKRHMALTIIDALMLLALALLFGFTIPWRQIFYPPQERFSEGRAGKINWPDLAVVILSFIVIGLVVLRSILAIMICIAEMKLQAIKPPTYILWSHKSGGQLRAERLANINRIETDRAVLNELFMQATDGDKAEDHWPIIPSFAEQNEKQFLSRQQALSSAPALPLKGDGKGKSKKGGGAGLPNASASGTFSAAGPSYSPSSAQSTVASLASIHKKSRIPASPGFQGIASVGIDATTTASTQSNKKSSANSQPLLGLDYSCIGLMGDGTEGDGVGDEDEILMMIVNGTNPERRRQDRAMRECDDPMFRPPISQLRRTANDDDDGHHDLDVYGSAGNKKGGANNKKNNTSTNLGIIFDEDMFAIVDDTFVDDVLFASVAATSAAEQTDNKGAKKTVGGSSRPTQKRNLDSMNNDDDAEGYERRGIQIDDFDFSRDERRTAVKYTAAAAAAASSSKAMKTPKRASNTTATTTANTNNNDNSPDAAVPLSVRFVTPSKPNSEDEERKGGKQGNQEETVTKEEMTFVASSVFHESVHKTKD